MGVFTLCLAVRGTPEVLRAGDVIAYHDPRVAKGKRSRLVATVLEVKPGGLANHLGPLVLSNGLGCILGKDSELVRLRSWIPVETQPSQQQSSPEPSPLPSQPAAAATAAAAAAAAAASAPALSSSELQSTQGTQGTAGQQQSGVGGPSPAPVAFEDPQARYKREKRSAKAAKAQADFGAEAAVAEPGPMAGGAAQAAGGVGSMPGGAAQAAGGVGAVIGGGGKPGRHELAVDAVWRALRSYTLIEGRIGAEAGFGVRAQRRHITLELIVFFVMFVARQRLVVLLLLVLAQCCSPRPSTLRNFFAVGPNRHRRGSYCGEREAPGGGGGAAQEILCRRRGAKRERLRRRRRGEQRQWRQERVGLEFQKAGGWSTLISHLPPLPLNCTVRISKSAGFSAAPPRSTERAREKWPRAKPPRRPPKCARSRTFLHGCRRPTKTRPHTQQQRQPQI